jgi:hypothetical protein
VTIRFAIEVSVQIECTGRSSRCTVAPHWAMRLFIHSLSKKKGAQHKKIDTFANRLLTSSSAFEHFAASRGKSAAVGPETGVRVYVSLTPLFGSCRIEMPFQYSDYGGGCKVKSSCLTCIHSFNNLDFTAFLHLHELFVAVCHR